MSIRVRLFGLIIVFCTSVLSIYGFEKELVDIDQKLYSDQRLIVDHGEVNIINLDNKTRLMCIAKPNEKVRFRIKAPQGTWNLKPYVNITVDFENPGKKEAFFRILIKDIKTKNESWYRPNLSHNAWIHAGENRSFDALLVRHKYANPAVKPDYMDRFPKMHGLPHGQMLVWYGIDVTQVSELVFELQPKSYTQKIT